MDPLDHLWVAWQPIMDLADGTAMGYASRTRGPEDTAQAMPVAQLARAPDAGKTPRWAPGGGRRLWDGLWGAAEQLALQPAIVKLDRILIAGIDHAVHQPSLIRAVRTWTGDRGLGQLSPSPRATQISITSLHTAHIAIGGPTRRAILHRR